MRVLSLLLSLIEVPSNCYIIDERNLGLQEQHFNLRNHGLKQSFNAKPIGCAGGSLVVAPLCLDGNALVSASCCGQVKKLGQNPAFPCAIMLSNTAKSTGVEAEIAITIPKRCNMADRPVGYKCGGLS
ncbi:hypothetical protein L6164_030017 [Bauhinia variegata]|uniref:Uncharacterized protein n=1 Tax=Bauhinia variegata TaxID=167791 RepID=A0ACB9LB36_BAUVA|nr:hypothetical protein L6164_030017 [Bauhinia variegata]